MTWSQWHNQSERLASEAEVAMRKNETSVAHGLYLQAAEAENQALIALDPLKTRTLGITAVSAASLWFKGKAFQKAEQLCYLMLSRADLPEFATDQLRNLVQAIWTEHSKQSAGVSFLPGQVYVSVKGGEVVTGGAPLDLIVDKVQAIQSIFYRTIEESNGMPLRIHGGPVRELQDACRPWIFQAPPGSYQFSVAIQEPKQPDMFRAAVDPSLIAERFLAVLRAAVSSDPTQLSLLVPDQGYRSTFLKLARNLAPTGKSFERLEIRSAVDNNSLALQPENRKLINATLKSMQKPTTTEVGEIEIVLHGILRAVNLDKDWIDVSVDGVPHHISGVAEALDDVIGPMVNRRVTVRARRGAAHGYRFEDIELDD
jgi:hypothetical protein